MVNNRVNAAWDTARHTSRSWYGMPDDSTESPIGYASRMLNDGWPEGVARLQEAIKTIAGIAPPESMRRRLAWCDNGDSIDMNRVYTGQLDKAWRRAKRQTSRAPAPVTIWVSFSIPFTASPDALFWRGAAVAALADLLQSAGYSVGIQAFNNGTGCVYGSSSPYFDFVTTVKPQGAPMDISTLAAAVALPSMVRGAEYGMEIVAMSEDGYKVDDGICHPSASPYNGMQPGDVSIPADTTTPERAAAWVAAQVEAIQNRNQQPQDLAASLCRVTVGTVGRFDPVTKRTEQ